MVKILTIVQTALRKVSVLVPCAVVAPRFSLKFIEIFPYA